MKRFASLFLLVSLMWACSPDSSRPILDEKKMADILVDQYLIQSVIVQRGAPLEERPTYYYNHILEKHQVTEAEFDSAVVWYTSHMDVYERVYEDVMNRLRNLEDSMATVVAREAAEGVGN